MTNTRLSALLSPCLYLSELGSSPDPSSLTLAAPSCEWLWVALLSLTGKRYLERDSWSQLDSEASSYSELRLCSCALLWAMHSKSRAGLGWWSAINNCVLIWFYPRIRSWVSCKIFVRQQGKFDIGATWEISLTCTGYRWACPWIPPHENLSIVRSSRS